MRTGLLALAEQLGTFTPLVGGPGIFLPAATPRVAGRGGGGHSAGEGGGVPEGHLT